MTFDLEERVRLAPSDVNVVNIRENVAFKSKIEDEISYGVITKRSDLWERWDEIVDRVGKMIAWTGSHGQTAESIMDLMLRYAESVNGFNLIACSRETKEIDGVLFAIATGLPQPATVEVIALWTKPFLATKIMFEVYEMLERWARSINCVKILTVITRSPELFFPFFHEKLGFEKVGIILERRIDDARG